MKNSRRIFLKGSTLGLLGLSFASLTSFLSEDSFEKSSLNSKPQSQDLSSAHLSYFIKDKGCLNANYQDIKAHRVLEVDNDIAEIYAELKQALENKAIIASKSSETTFFVIRTMAAGYGLRVVYSEEENGVHSWIMAPKNVNLKG